MLGQVLLRGTFPRQCERLNRHFSCVQPRRTFRLPSSGVRPLSMQAEPNVSVYAKDEAGLQSAKALLSKVCSLSFRNHNLLPGVTLHFESCAKLSNIGCRISW